MVIIIVKTPKLSEDNKVYVIFKINNKDKITEVKARAEHPALEAEAQRVIYLFITKDETRKA